MPIVCLPVVSRKMLTQWERQIMHWHFYKRVLILAYVKHGGEHVCTCLCMSLESIGWYQVSSLVTCHLIIWGKISHWTWNSTVHRSWLGRVLQGSIHPSVSPGQRLNETQTTMPSLHTVLWRALYLLSHLPKPPLQNSSEFTYSQKVLNSL